MVTNKEEDKENTDPIEAEGWKRQFTVEHKRVSEYVELYESIGYEVRVEPAIPNEKEECQVCYKIDFSNLSTIYTKRKKNKDNEMDLEEVI